MSSVSYFIKKKQINLKEVVFEIDCFLLFSHFITYFPFFSLLEVKYMN